MQERPFFMSNEAWYTYNEAEGKLVLTDEAPPEAIESFNTFYAEEHDDNGKVIKH